MAAEDVAECHTCGERWEGKNALMVGKKHAMDTGHTVAWEMNRGGIWDQYGRES